MNVIQQLEQNSLESPSKIALIIVNADGDQSYTRKDFFQLILKHAALVSSFNLPDKTVIPIIKENSIELWASFFGIMATGHIPTILPIPNFKTHIPTYQRNIENLFKRYGFATIATSSNIFSKINVEGKDNNIKWINLESSNELQPIIKQTEINENDVAFLQHSSGSTGIQKGVVITHKMIMDHIQEYSRIIYLNNEDKVISWLPLYHDMGLVACCLLPLLSGIPVISLSPTDWVKNPLSIFIKTDEYKASLCWLPNFSYNYLSDKVSKNNDHNFSLSSLRMIINCSEPILDSSHQKFINSFKKYGLKESALSTCYAMAENVFAVTQTPASESIQRMRLLNKSVEKGMKIQETKDLNNSFYAVSSGVKLSSVNIKILDTNMNLLENGVVGEIALSGPSCFLEYYKNEEKTKVAFNSDGYYLTGDLGFMYNNHLFVTGRVKDLIIVAGRNFYANDIEEIVNQIESVKKGRVVAFGVISQRTGTDEVVVMLESDDYNEAKIVSNLKIQIKTELMTKLDCAVDKIIINPPNALIKTSSGKIARTDNKNLFLNMYEG